MCNAGARTETAKQLKELLNVSHLNDQQILELNHSYLNTVNNSLGQNIKINTANKIYPNQGFQINQDYVNLLAKHFQSEIQQLNYRNAQEAANIINKWVEQKTNDKIKDLIDPMIFNDLTRLVLVNAIYFKGDWLTKFQPQGTEKLDFHLGDGSIQKVDMMRLYNKKFKYIYRPHDILANTLELPYIGETIAMTIILPHEDTTLDVIEKQLTAELIYEVLSSNLGSSGEAKDPIHLQLPKFKLEHKQEVNKFYIYSPSLNWSNTTSASFP